MHSCNRPLQRRVLRGGRLLVARAAALEEVLATLRGEQETAAAEHAALHMGSMVGAPSILYGMVYARDLRAEDETSAARMAHY